MARVAETPHILEQLRGSFSEPRPAAELTSLCDILRSPKQKARAAKEQGREASASAASTGRPLPPTSRKRKEAPQAALTKQHEKRVRTGEEIERRPATIDDAVYMPAVLCHLGMPRSRYQGRYFERNYSSPTFSASLRMEAGALYLGEKKGWVEQPMPYGLKPRQILLTLFTAAKKTGNRFIDAGRSTREFMLRAGMDPQGSEYRSFMTQMQALAVCSFRMGRSYGDSYAGRRIQQTNGQIVKNFEAWVIHDDRGQEVLWPGTIELTPEMMDDLVETLVPLDERAARQFDGALEADIYFWATQRLCRVQNRRGTFVTWQALKDQFASRDYGTVKKFRQEFIKSMRQVQELYRDARWRIDEDETGKAAPGMLLLPSKPPIPKAIVQVSKDV